MKTFYRFLLVSLFACALVGCVTTPVVDAKAPEDFAALDAGEHGILKAVNPQGVVYRVRTEKPEPQAALAFWKEALTHKLMADGYIVLGTTDATVGGQPGAKIEAVAPLADADYGFVVLISQVGDELLIVEGGGERVAWDKVKPQMIAAAAAISLKR